MENIAILSRKTFSNALKSFFVGAFVGVALSVAVLRLVYLYGGRESEVSAFLMRPYFLTVWLAENSCKVTGHDWPIGGRILNRSSLSLILATNALFFGLLGAGLIQVLQHYKSRKKAKL